VAYFNAFQCTIPVGIRLRRLRETSYRISKFKLDNFQI